MITLANGKSYNTVAIFSNTQNFQNSQREIFEIHFKADETEQDGYKLETISALYNNPAPFDNIKIYEDTPDEAGNCAFLSEHLHTTIPVKFTTETIDDVKRYIIKIAQLSELEIMQKEQAEQIALLQDCVLELSAK